MWSVDLSRSSSQLIVSMLSFLNQSFIVFSQYYFNRFKSGVTPHCLHSDLLTLILLPVSFRVTFNQHFCRWRCFSYYWFVKREFGKFTNVILVIGGPTRPLPRPPHLINTTKVSAKIDQRHRKFIVFCTAMIVKHLTLTFLLTCCWLTLIYCPYFCIMVTIRSVIMKSTMH